MTRPLCLYLLRRHSRSRSAGVLVKGRDRGQVATPWRRRVMSLDGTVPIAQQATVKSSNSLKHLLFWPGKLEYCGLTGQKSGRLCADTLHLPYSEEMKLGRNATYTAAIESAERSLTRPKASGERRTVTAEMEQRNGSANAFQQKRILLTRYRTLFIPEERLAWLAGSATSQNTVDGDHARRSEDRRWAIRLSGSRWGGKAGTGLDGSSVWPSPPHPGHAQCRNGKGLGGMVLLWCSSALEERPV